MYSFVLPYNYYCTYIILHNLVCNACCVEVPTPGAMSSVMQRSLTTARVNLTVGDDRCADLYVVEVTGGSTPLITVSNTSPEFDVSGLFLCRYIYTFVAYTQAPSGAQSMRTTLRSLDTSGAGTMYILLSLGLASWTIKLIVVCLLPRYMICRWHASLN